MSHQILRALVIDPDPHVLANAVRMLAQKGIHVAARITPDDSLDYVKRARPNVVLLGRGFWNEGWRTEILAASPQTVVLPVHEPAPAAGVA